MGLRKLLPIKTGLLRDQVRDRVFEAIMAGVFHPGQALREMELARDLRVSQATVREALLQLEQTGLVVRVPNKETTVTRLSLSELRERKWVRSILEPEAGVEAARRMKSEDFDELKRRLDTIAKAVSKNAYFDLAQADLAFHRFIWKAANETVYRLLDNLTAPMFAFVTIIRSSEKEDLTPLVRDHEPILEALKQNDPALIRTRIREHIDNSYHELLDSDRKDFQALSRSRGKAEIDVS